MASIHNEVAQCVFSQRNLCLLYEAGEVPRCHPSFVSSSPRTSRKTHKDFFSVEFRLFLCEKRQTGNSSLSLFWRVSQFKLRSKLSPDKAESCESSQPPAKTCFHESPVLVAQFLCCIIFSQKGQKFFMAEVFIFVYSLALSSIFQPLCIVLLWHMRHCSLAILEVAMSVILERLGRHPREAS